jgi:hypothetical protein
MENPMNLEKPMNLTEPDFDSRTETLESLLDVFSPPDAEFPVSFGYAGVFALGRKDSKSGGGSVQRTWLGNAIAALEYAGACQELIGAIAPIPEGYKKQKISRIGFLVLKSLGQHCDSNRAVLGEDGQLVWDGDRPKTRSVEAMDVRSYAADVLRPKLAQAGLLAAGTEEEVETVRPEVVDFSSSLTLVEEDAETQASQAIESWGSRAQSTLSQTSDLVAQALERAAIYQERALGDANSLSAQASGQLKQLGAQEQALVRQIFQLKGAQGAAQVEAILNAAEAHGQQVRVGKLAELLNWEVHQGSANG